METAFWGKSIFFIFHEELYFYRTQSVSFSMSYIQAFSFLVAMSCVSAALVFLNTLCIFAKFSFFFYIRRLFDLIALLITWVIHWMPTLNLIYVLISFQNHEITLHTWEFSRNTGCSFDVLLMMQCHGKLLWMNRNHVKYTDLPTTVFPWLPTVLSLGSHKSQSIFDMHPGN